MKRMENKGFTLVELLATLAVISMILSITMYTIINAINEGKKKTYLTTINEIEKAAGNYSIENARDIYFISANTKEYQCVTIQDLIDYGFLKTDITKSMVSENKNVEVFDYVYLERDSKTKALNKKIYINDASGAGDSFCAGNQAIQASAGNIVYDYNPKEWSKSKTINIKYILRNVSNRNDYVYGYLYSSENGSTLIAHTTTDDNPVKVTVNSKGAVTADIFNMSTSNEVVSKSLSINKIDNDGPTISLIDNTTRYVSKNASIALNIEDCDDNNCSGLNEAILTSEKLSSIVKNNFVVTIDDYVVPSNNLSLKKVNTSRFDLTINDTEHNGVVSIEIDGNTFTDSVVEDEKNGNAYVKLATGVIFDNTKPVIMAVSTHNYFVNNQTLNINCEDNYALGGYYYGNTSPNSSYSNISFTAINSLKTHTDSASIKTAGTYYVVCKDIAGNVSTSKNIYHNFIIKSMLLNYSGTASIHDTTNYSEYSSYSYLLYEGDRIPLATVNSSLNNIVPVGSNINHYTGYSKNDNNSNGITFIAKDSASANDFVINGNFTYRFWFERNMLKVKYRVNSGETFVPGSSSTTTYSWNLDNNFVKRKNISNGSSTTLFHNYRYSDNEISIDLFNNSTDGFFAIQKDGYVPKTGSEWKCESGCKTNNLTLPQNSYKVNVNNVICDITSSDCAIILNANFEPITYTIKYEMNGAAAKANDIGTYNTAKNIANPSKNFVVSIDKNGTGATIKNSAGTVVTNASVSQAFNGWTSSNVESNAKTGTSSSGATNTWTGSLTKHTYFKNLRDTAGTVTLTANWATPNVTLPLVTKVGNTCGYATSSTGTIAYSSGGSYPSSATLSGATLYVKCNTNKVRVKYHMNGGSLAQNHGASYGTSGSYVTNSGSTIIQTFDYGGTLGTSGLVNYNNSSYMNISYAGHIAKSKQEWCKNSDGTGTCFNQANIDSTNNITPGDLCDASSGDCTVTLYVNWISSSTVSFNCTQNGGKGTVDSVSGEVGKSVTLPTSGCSKSGWTFVGWNTNKDATTRLTSYSIQNSNTTLYAIYSKECTINYYGNGFYIGKTTDTSADNYNSLTCDDSSNSCVSKCTRYNNQTSCGVRTPVIDELSNKKFFSPSINDQRPWTADSDQLYRDAAFGCKESFDGNDYYVPNDYVNGDRYNCQNYTQYTNFNNKHRTAIYHITTCNGLLCNYNKINSIGLDGDFSLELTGNPNSNQPPWTVLRSELSFDFEDGCAVSYYATQNVNCYSSIGSNTVAMTLSKCTSITSYRTTKRIDQSGGTNWYYLSEGKCYINGAYLQTPVPSGCSGDAPTVTNVKNSVILNPNGGTWASGSGNKKVSYEDRLNLSEFPRISRSGYRLTGWNINSPSGTLYTYYVDAADSGKTLYAHWTQTSGGGSSSSSGSGYSYCYCPGSGYQLYNGRCYTSAGTYTSIGACKSVINGSSVNYGFCSKVGTGYTAWVNTNFSPPKKCN